MTEKKEKGLVRRYQSKYSRWNRTVPKVGMGEKISPETSISSPELGYNKKS